jgi:hypothetical protein
MLALTLRYGMERRLLALCFYIRTVALLYDTWGRGKAFAQMTLHGLEIVTVAFKVLNIYEICEFRVGHCAFRGYSPYKLAPLPLIIVNKRAAQTSIERKYCWRFQPSRTKGQRSNVEICSLKEDLIVNSCA